MHMLWNGAIDLQAALVSDPGNPEASALLHRRSVTLEMARLSETDMKVENHFS
jgi:hypothetical protein